MPIIAAALGAACALWSLSCNQGANDVIDVAGRFDYIAWNAGDTAVVSGTIVVVRLDSSRLTGTWTLAALGHPYGIGPQTGAGSLTGTYTDSLRIGLNPSMVDNNVILTGKPHIAEITGRWQWVTLTGVSGEGRFVMTKR